MSQFEMPGVCSAKVPNGVRSSHHRPPFFYCGFWCKLGFMRKIFFIAVSIVVLAGYAFAQRPTPSPSAPPPPPQPPPVVMQCPTIAIAGPTGVIAAGETMRYSARVDMRDQPLSVEYKWTVSPAVAFAGQGGPEIEFERPASARNNVTVQLELLGLPQHCPRNASETASWTPAPVAARIDQLMGPLPKTLDQRIKRIANSLRNQPTAQLFVVLEYPTDATEAAAKEKGRLIASLLKTAGLEDTRITYALGKTSRERVQFWLVPAGAEYPKIEK